MSSRYTTTNLSRYSWKTEFMSREKVAGAFADSGRTCQHTGDIPHRPSAVSAGDVDSTDIVTEPVLWPGTAIVHLGASRKLEIGQCKLEILTNYSSSEKPAHLNMQPHKWGQYNDVLANDTYMVAVLWNN